MKNISCQGSTLLSSPLKLFICVSVFFFFEAIQMSYFDVVAPYFISYHWYTGNQTASLSAAYYYGNVLGVIPAGLSLDKKNVRRILMTAISFSAIGAIILAVTDQFLIGWLARFICGFFGGAYCFLGGVKVLARAVPNRFTLAIGFFITAGMLAGMAAQLPMLWIIEWSGIPGAMQAVAILGIIVFLLNWFWLYPDEKEFNIIPNNNFGWVTVLSQWRNFLYGILISAINTPVSILGNLWGIVVLTHFYHFSNTVCAGIMMLLFLGLMIGSPLVGELADRFKVSIFLMSVGCIGSLLTVVFLTFSSKILSIFEVSAGFLILGIFSSCQTLVYSWLNEDNNSRVIGRVMAMNSIILMGISGLVKQIAAKALELPAFLKLHDPSGNLLIMIGSALLLSIVIIPIVKVRLR